jgi:hypothetical protein
MPPPNDQTPFVREAGRRARFACVRRSHGARGSRAWFGRGTALTRAPPDCRIRPRFRKSVDVAPRLARWNELDTLAYRWEECPNDRNGAVSTRLPLPERTGTLKVTVGRDRRFPRLRKSSRRSAALMVWTKRSSAYRGSDEMTASPLPSSSHVIEIAATVGTVSAYART